MTSSSIYVCECMSGRDWILLSSILKSRNAITFSVCVSHESYDSCVSHIRVVCTFYNSSFNEDWMI